MASCCLAASRADCRSRQASAQGFTGGACRLGSEPRGTGDDRTGRRSRTFNAPVALGRRRMPLATVLSGAGYDSEDNHRLSRQELGIRSVIPATCGRPGAKGPTGRYRRLMRRRFKDGRIQQHFGQRRQAETVTSMVKRDLGSAGGARTPRGRKKDMPPRAITHNLMIIANP
jgi:hypothetical protein